MSSIINRPFTYTYFNATLYLIGINIFIFVLQYFFSISTIFLAMTPSLVLEGWLWQFVTYMFAHGGISHIFFNMFALFIFGVHIERYIGSKEFLLYYLLTGTLAGIFSFAVYTLSGAYGNHLLGASGAIFAVQLSYACFFPNNILYVWGLIPLRAPVLVLIFTAIEIFEAVSRTASGVAHLTHLAGIGFGCLYFIIRFKANPVKLMLGR